MSDPGAEAARRALKAARRRNADELIDALTDPALSDPDRRNLYEPLSRKPRFRPPGSGTEMKRHDQVSLIGLLGTAGVADIRREIGLPSTNLPPRLWEVVAARPTRTVEAITRFVLNDDWHWWLWPLVRDLVRHGVIAHPDDDAYHLGLVPGTRPPGPERRAPVVGG